MLAAANSAGAVESIPTQGSGFSRAATRIWNDYPEEVKVAEMTISDVGDQASSEDSSKAAVRLTTSKTDKL